jgi:uncharacterized membrane protein
LHPFDLKTVLFAKHAQHVGLIHFPIALFIIGVLFDFLAQWKKQNPPKHSDTRTWETPVKARRCNTIDYLRQTTGWRFESSWFTQFPTKMTVPEYGKADCRLIAPFVNNVSAKFR